METKTVLSLVMFSTIINLWILLGSFALLAADRYCSESACIGLMWATALFVMVLSVVLSSSTKLGSRGVHPTYRTSRQLYVFTVAAFVFAVIPIELCLLGSYFTLKAKLNISRFDEFDFGWKITLCLGYGFAEVLIISAIIFVYMTNSVNKEKVEAELPLRQEITEILEAQMRRLDAHHQQVIQTLHANTTQIMFDHNQDVVVHTNKPQPQAAATSSRRIGVKR